MESDLGQVWSFLKLGTIGSWEWS